MRERYWAFYLSLKHRSYYYKSFQILFKRINWAISSFLSLTTLSCIAAWDLWKNFQILWVILICISQVIQVFFPKMPYNDLLISTKFMISALDKLLLQVDHDWLSIDVHHFSDDRILELLETRQSQYSELVAQFFSGDYLPVIKYCEDKAEQDCKTFFSVTYPSYEEENK